MSRARPITRYLGLVLACSAVSIGSAGQAPPSGTIMGRVGTQGNTAPGDQGFVVWVDDVPGDFPPPKSYVSIDQKGMHFIPDLIAVLVGTTVEFRNSDPILHNVYSFSPAKRFNLGLYSKDRAPAVLFDKPGVVAVYCNVHPDMSAYVVVLKNPFFAVAGSSGTFVIRNVPAGNRTVKCWSKDGKIQEKKITVNPGSVEKVDFPE